MFVFVHCHGSYRVDGTHARGSVSCGAIVVLRIMFSYFYISLMRKLFVKGLWTLLKLFGRGLCTRLASFDYTISHH